MAGLTALRFVSALLLLMVQIRAVSAAPASDPNEACSAGHDIKVHNARLVIDPDVAAKSAKLTLSGRAAIPDAALSAPDPARALCLATLGDDFRVNATYVCSNVSGGFRSEDQFEKNGDFSDFSLSTSLGQQQPIVLLHLDAGRSICVDRLLVEVHPGDHGRFSYISSMPSRLADDRAEFEIKSEGSAEGLNIQVFLDQSAVRTPESPPSLSGPKSWNEPIEGVRLQQLARVFAMSLTFAAVLAFFQRWSPLPTALRSLCHRLEICVATALAFSMTAAWMDFAGEVTSFLIRDAAQFDRFLRWISNSMSFEWVREVITGNPRMAVQSLLAVGALTVAGIVNIVVGWPLRRLGFVGQVAAFPLRVAFRGTLISAAAFLFSWLVFVCEGELQWAGFEAPALLVSVFFALIAASAVRDLFCLSRNQAIGLAALVAVTAFFPTDPVVLSTGGAAIGENTAFWAMFVGRFAAIFLYVAALTGFAFRVAEASGMSDRLVASWLIFLLVLQISSFGIAVPTNAFAVAGVVLASSPWLLAAYDVDDDARTRSAAESLVWELEEETFPFIVGGAAAGIFLLQFIFEASTGDRPGEFALLGLAQVPRVFAVGATAGLLLARSGPVLRGDSAILKAANISALLIVSRMASELTSLRGRQGLIGVLASELGVIAALMLCAMLVYDLQRAKANDGHFEWRDLFKGTTLARAVPIVSAIAVALFSALSPIFIHEVGDAFGALLKNALPSQLPAAQ
jgi:hypothetical protein